MLEGQAALELFALGDVGIDAKDTERCAILRLRNDLALTENPFIRSVLAPHPVFIGNYRGLAPDVSLKIDHELRAIVRMDRWCPFVYAAADFIVRIAEHALPSVGEEDSVRGGIPLPQANAAAFKGERPVLVAET
jgi:hypothetical protein